VFLESAHGFPFHNKCKHVGSKSRTTAVVAPSFRALGYLQGQQGREKRLWLLTEVQHVSAQAADAAEPAPPEECQRRELFSIVDEDYKGSRV